MLLREAPISTGRPSRASAGTPARRARLCSSVLPNPMPGSRMIRSGHAGRDRGREALGQVVADLGHDVPVARIALHRARRAAHVHQAHGGAALGHQRQQVGIAAPGGDVVHEHGARVERGPATAASEVSTERASAPALPAARAGRPSGARAARRPPPDRPRAGCSRRRRRRSPRRRRPSAPAAGGPPPDRSPRAARQRVGGDVEDPHDARGRARRAGRPRPRLMAALRPYIRSAAM